MEMTTFKILYAIVGIVTMGLGIFAIIRMIRMQQKAAKQAKRQQRRAQEIKYGLSDEARKILRLATHRYNEMYPDGTQTQAAMNTYLLSLITEQIDKLNKAKEEIQVLQNSIKAIHKRFIS